MSFKKLLHPTKSALTFAVVLAVISQFADFFSTVFALNNGAEEANPIVAAVLAWGGYWLFFVFKLTAVAFFSALGSTSRIFALVLSVPFFYVSVNNVIIALELRGL